MLRLASLMRSAIRRRSADHLDFRSFPPAWPRGAAVAARAPLRLPPNRRAGCARPGRTPRRSKIDAGLTRPPPIGRRGHDPALLRRGAVAAGCRRRRCCQPAAPRRLRGAPSRSPQVRRCRRRRAPLRSPPHVEHDQRRAHRHLVARCAGDRHHPAAHRRRHFHRRLVGHDFDDELVFGHGVARLGVPGDDFRLDRAFTQIRHLEDELAHADSMTALSAVATRAWPGKYSHSKACG